MQTVRNEKTFPEPQLVIFTNRESMNGTQGVIVAEKEVLLPIENFTVIKGLTLLMATYYMFFVSYPKSTAASSFLLFVQEFLLGFKELSTNHLLMLYFENTNHSVF